MLIDVTRLVDRTLKQRLPTGVDRVSLEYIRHFSLQARALVRFAGRWVELGDFGSALLFDALLNDVPDRMGVIRRSVGRGYAFSWRRHRGAFLFNTGHSGLDQPVYVEEVRRKDLRPLFFLHDLIPISHPEYCRPGEAERHHRRLETMLSVGRGLLVNSQATLEELTSYVAERDIDMPPCKVAPLAPASLGRPALESYISGPYFVVLGTIEPRKNHLLLLHVWRQLVEEMGPGAPKLVLIGQRGWECEQIVDLLERCTSLQAVVVERSRCDDLELANWLGHSRALLFPSFIEGYGMPLVESLRLGVPVIASDLPVFREIVGDIPDYLDPVDGLGWKRHILEYLPDDSVSRRAQLQRMAGYAPPDWRQHFSVVESLIDQITHSS
ncbi:glycosyltransferase family 4 protein [Zoogloea dura]|uniref:Glycosyltransferase family 4 protein n=1 Tax=Zoogloea dura TaxID=2728840 RepID=A0A848G8P9_9RHOO|nr:glycosyltransferase family 1 protein [Zoogloea dura]NML25951.1 glycosyltransferase family 4 protein [Zoogloea dura]